MIEKYKKDLDQVHAPASLVESTLRRIEELERNPEANQSADSDARRNTGQESGAGRQAGSRRFIIFRRSAPARASLVAAAAVVVIVSVSLLRPNDHFTEIPANTVVRSLSENEVGSAATDSDIEDYNDFIGTDCRELLGDDASFTGGSTSLEQDGDTVTDDQGTFYYSVDGTEFMLVLSRTHDVTPAAMKDLEESKVAGQSVILAKSESEGETASYYAAGKKDDVSFYLYSARTDEESFMKVLKQLLKSDL